MMFESVFHCEREEEEVRETDRWKPALSMKMTKLCCIVVSEGGLEAMHCGHVQTGWGRHNEQRRVPLSRSSRRSGLVIDVNFECERVDESASSLVQYMLRLYRW